MGKSGITRRRFLNFGSKACLTAGVFAGVSAAQAPPHDKERQEAARSSPASAGKVALEEHFAFPGTTYQIPPTPDFELQIKDLADRRIADMDRGGVDISIVSQVGPGLQAITDTKEAIAAARRWNDYLAEHIAKNSRRLKGFAALPMQDPQAASQELTRCIKELGFCGALVNGFSQVGDSGVFYDLPQYRPFWATVQQLNVPFYLHPRAPLPASQREYEGYPWLAGSVWGFAVETANHALRLMASGLFDEFPRLKIVLGHMGEGLPFSIWRADNRIARLQLQTKAQVPMTEYLRRNFYITTSGVFCTPPLSDTLLQIGTDRVLYSVDYPYEDVVAASSWFEGAPLSAADRAKIARGNAAQLFHL
jgi:2,3-dihydroxybenzoate decarboxylase